MTIYQINRLRSQTAQRRRILYSTPPSSVPEPASLQTPVEDDASMRWDKIRDLRQAILAGEYDLDTRMEKLLQNAPALANLQSE